MIHRMWNSVSFPRALQEYKMPWPTSNAPCARCLANTTTHPFTDCRPTAAWRGTEWTPAGFDAAHPNRHIVFTIPGVSIYSITFDLMHCKHLGIDQYFLGSVLWILVYLMLPNDKADNLARIMARAKLYWHAHFVKGHFQNMKLSMFCNKENPKSDFPRLKGRAAEVKSLIPALLSICTLNSDPTDNAHCAHLP